MSKNTASLNKEPFVRTPYNYNTDAASIESGLACKDASLTQQHQAEQADINYLIKQFNVTGIMPHNPLPPQFGDFTGVGDFKEAMDRVISVDEQFMALPADLRAQFENDPFELIEFLNNPENKDKAIEMGLIAPVSSTAELPKNEATSPTPEEGA
jgi:phage internal scaffolding protein